VLRLIDNLQYDVVVYWQLGHAVIAAMFNLKASELALAMTTQPKRVQVGQSYSVAECT